MIIYLQMIYCYIIIRKKTQYQHPGCEVADKKKRKGFVAIRHISVISTIEYYLKIEITWLGLLKHPIMAIKT